MERGLQKMCAWVTDIWAAKCRKCFWDKSLNMYWEMKVSFVAKSDGEVKEIQKSQQNNLWKENSYPKCCVYVQNM